MGSSQGNIFIVSVVIEGTEQKFVWHDEYSYPNKGVENAVICMCSDPTSKTLCAVTGNGQTMLMKVKKSKNWECNIDIGHDYPALTVDVLLRA